MKRIHWALFLSLLTLSLSWILSLGVQTKPLNPQALLLEYSGLLAIGSMSLSLLLATRLPWLMKLLSGLDKAYRLHKWLGITTLLSALTHWWIANNTSQGSSQDFTQDPLYQGIDILHQSGFYLALLLLVVALIKKIPYHWFARSHKWLALCYLTLALHSVLSLNPTSWLRPAGIILATLILTGTLSSLTILIKGAGQQLRRKGTITNIEPYPQSDSHLLTLEVPQWPGHRAGQFLFLSKDGESERAHPFTLSSNWQKDNPKLELLIKSLGDYTSKLSEHLRVDDSITIEGPYGAFTFEDDKPLQIWIAGGIGITPFLARLKELRQQEESKQKITLFYCYRTCEPKLLQEIQELAQLSQVDLKLWPSEKGRLNAETIQDLTPEYKLASIWFCGPKPFGDSLYQAFKRKGLSSSNFHQELFEMR